MRRVVSIACLTFIGCVHAQPAPTEEPIPVPAPLSAEAAGFFSRANSPDAVGSIVVDFDEMRAHRLIGPSKGGRSPYVDLLVGVAAGAAPYLKEGKDTELGVMLTRATVLIGLLRAWDAWPKIQRAGIILPWLKPSAPAQGLMIVFAVPADAATNQDLLRGIAAIDRATGKPLFAVQNGRLCASLGQEADAKFGQICAAAGAGYLMLATSQGIDDLLKPVAALVPPPPAFVRIRANVAGVGHGEIVADWQAGLHLGITATPGQPQMAERLEKLFNQGLQTLDQSRQQTRDNLTPVLTAAQSGLAKDPDAPAALKAAAATITTDGLLDPDNTYQTWRSSVHITRADSTVTATATMPEESVRKAIKQYDLLTLSAAAGVIAAIAIPNFLKFQSRSKQSEARANLKAIATAQKSYYAEQNHYGKTFDVIGFAPEKGRYSYCMAGKCLPCGQADCFAPPPSQNKCIEITKEYANDDGSEGFLACAIGDPEGKKDPEHMDVWTVTEDGQPQHVSAEAGSED